MKKYLGAALKLLVAASAFMAASIAPSAQAATWTTYSMTNDYSSECLEIGGDSELNGATANQWSCNGSATQLWQVGWFDQNTKTYSIVNGHSGKCLEIRGDSTASGALANQWDCNDSATQRWTLNADSNGHIQIVNVNSGLCLEIRGDNPYNGATANQ